MSQEPEYLKRLIAGQGQKKGAGRAVGAGKSATPPLTVQEQEAVKWAREVAGTKLRSIKGVHGAKYVLLYRLSSASGIKMTSLEGVDSRDGLITRIKNGIMMGEEMVAGYDVRGGRPAEVTITSGEVAIKMGQPRPGANPVPPEKMLRRAAQQAVELAKKKPQGTSSRGAKGKGSSR